MSFIYKICLLYPYWFLKTLNSFGMDDNNIYNNLVKYANKDIMISNVYDTNSNSNIKIFFVYISMKIKLINFLALNLSY